MTWFYSEKPGEGSSDKKGNRTYTRKFLVETDDSSLYAPDVWGLLPIVRYDPFPSDIEAVADTVRATPVSDQLFFWDVNYTYNTDASDEGNSANDQSANDQSVEPPDRPLIITPFATETEKPLPVDQDGVPILTAANQPFDPAPTTPVAIIGFKFSFYRDADFDDVTPIQTYLNKVNSAAFVIPYKLDMTLTFPAKSLKCTAYTPSIEKQNSEYWTKVEGEILYNPEGWNPLQILNAGTCYLSTIGPYPIMDPHGQPVQSPIPLGLDGLPLLPADSPVYLDFKQYAEVSFSSLLA
jgi:hypothetical protein